MRDLFRKFPDDATAEAWIAGIRWPDGPECPRCGCTNVQHPTAHKTMPYRCRGKGCWRFFSVRVGTVMQDSKLGYQEWAIGFYLHNTSGPTLRGFVQDRSADGAMVYSDDHRAYRGLPHHETVRHSVAEYVNGQAHMNGIESFWAGLKRAYHGTFHHVSAEHLDRYVCEAAGRHNRRGLDTLAMMERMVAGMVGRHLPYADLIADGPHARKRDAELAGIPPGHPF
ncbi:MAG: IS1595 family transposase [bacterium]|nr:IS1595 family transposase [bacterium]MDE0668665.1 IS1595 family transposase [bacterium]